MTVEEVAAERRKRMTSSKPTPPAETESKDEKTSVEHAVQDPRSPEELEEEAGAQGAFNPETGEINWDCPCLGGMAHGPCGEEFKAAFSCFVFSEEEPKGMDCIDKFK
jgi:mitochondrial intermembrane space import and assembly protein 40